MEYKLYKTTVCNKSKASHLRLPLEGKADTANGSRITDIDFVQIQGADCLSCNKPCASNTGFFFLLYTDRRGRRSLQ